MYVILAFQKASMRLPMKINNLFSTTEQDDLFPEHFIFDIAALFPANNTNSQKCGNTSVN
jgi:hypothetical protein